MEWILKTCVQSGWKKEIVEKTIIKQQLRAYIRRLIRMNYTEEIITRQCVQIGWKEEMIKQIIKEEKE